MKNHNPEVLAYAAGLFDGEGNITVRGRRDGRTHLMAVRLTNTDRDIITWLQETFGGSVHGNRQPKGNRRDAWLWQLGSRASAEFLQAIYPYLRIKRVEAEIAMEMGELLAARAKGTGAPKRLTDEDVARRADVAARFKEVRRARTPTIGG